jgi:predicted TIM-barrel fold metal-dependent hydrolase
VGAGGTPEANLRSNPTMLADIVRAFPDLRLVACHFGGFHQLDEAEQEVVGMDVMLETSWPPTLAGLDRDRVIDIITRHGADRIVFGSDWPMTDPAAEIAVIRGLGFDEAATAAILGGNLARLLGIAG